MDADMASFEYTNHRGETTTRTVRPIRIHFGSTAWHPEPQWLMEVFDVDKVATRDYAMSGINYSSWRKAVPARDREGAAGPGGEVRGERREGRAGERGGTRGGAHSGTGTRPAAGPNDPPGAAPAARDRTINYDTYRAAWGTVLVMLIVLGGVITLVWEELTGRAKPCR